LNENIRGGVQKMGGSTEKVSTVKIELAKLTRECKTTLKHTIPDSQRKGGQRRGEETSVIVGAKRGAGGSKKM